MCQYSTFLRLIRLTLLLTLCVEVVPAAKAEHLVSPHLDVALISDHESIKQNEPFRFGIWFKPEPDWHVYWRYAGDSGSPAHMQWKLPEQLEAGETQWPTPERLPIGPLVNYGYNKEVTLFRQGTYQGNQNSISIGIDLEWLVCREECIPGNALLNLELPVSAASTLNESWSAAFAAAQNAVPESASNDLFTAEVTDTTVTLRGAGSVDKDSNVFFFPSQAFLKNAAPQKLTVNDESYILQLELNQNYAKKLTAIDGVIRSSKGFSGRGTEEALAVSIPLSETQVAAPVSTQQVSDQSPKQLTEKASEKSPARFAEQSMDLWTALFFGFLGGILLNLMPCVLPVLSLKILSFVEHDAHKRLSGALWYAAGLLVTMLLLASVLAGSKELGWGFQLQSPQFIGIMAIIMLLVALSLLGVFELSGTSRNYLTKHIPTEGPVAEFFNGVLVTILATPCSAPFMASAIGYALSTSGAKTYAIFTALALGLSAPILLIALIPKAACILPKPGNWMVTLKELLAFPLLGTVIWLLWIFGLQTNFSASIQMLWILLGAGFCAWLLSSLHIYKKVAIILILCSGSYLVHDVVMHVAASRPSEGSNHEVATRAYGDLKTEPYSPSRLAALREQKVPVFVDFTAAWCITCQVNKKLVFGSDETVAALKAKNVTVLEADWTNQDKAIADELAAFGRKGVPLNLVYKPGAAEPQILPQILTPEILIDAFQ